MSHRFPITLALLLGLGAFAGACNGKLAQSDLDALDTLPLPDRIEQLETLNAAHPLDHRLPGLLAKARWETYEDVSAPDRIAQIKSALREDPENAITSKLLGDAYYDYSREGGGINYLDSALFAYENAALKNPRFMAAVGSVGAIYDEKEDFEQAIQWYEKALELDPEHVATLCNIGASYYNKGDYAKSLDRYRQALVLDPSSQDAHYNLGVAFAEATIYREAIREWNEVVAVDSSTAVAKQAAKNAELLQDVLDQTIYQSGRKSRRMSLEVGN